MVSSRKWERAEELSVGGGAFLRGQQREAAQPAQAQLQQWDHSGGDGGWKR